MFTGIVQDLVSVVALDREVDLQRITLNLGSLAEGLELGASVAVNGTCLTVTAVEGGYTRFDVIKETLTHTNLGELAVDDRVNVERSFRVGDEVGGHMVSGHITGPASLNNLIDNGHERVLSFHAEAPWLRFILHKGYVALDGASLTISRVDRAQNTFSVSLIPETIARTTLGKLTQGQRVNVEVDSQTQTIVETVERMMQDQETRNRLISA